MDIVIKSEDNYLTCRHSGCTKTFKTSGGRCKHQRKCKYPRPSKLIDYEKVDEGFRCLKCGRLYGHRGNFSRHIKTIHNPSRKPRKTTHKCEVCGKGFKKNSKLVRHALTHTRKTFQCLKCGQIYRRIDHFKRHCSSCKGAACSDTTELPTLVALKSNRALLLESLETQLCCDETSREKPNSPALLGDFKTFDSASPSYNDPESEQEMSPFPANDIATPVPLSCDKDEHDELGEGRSNEEIEHKEKSSSNFDATSVASASGEDGSKSVFDDENILKVFTGVFQFFRGLDCKLDKDRGVFCSLLYSIFGNDVFNSSTLDWITKHLVWHYSSKNIQDLMKIWLTTESLPPIPKNDNDHCIRQRLLLRQWRSD